MGLYEQADDLSFLLTLGSMATFASFQIGGKWLVARQLLNRLWMATLACSQQALRSCTVTLSMPSEVLVTLIVFRSTSSSEIPWF
jgi:hypothetical protein